MRSYGGKACSFGSLQARATMWRLGFCGEREPKGFPRRKIGTHAADIHVLRIMYIMVNLRCSTWRCLIPRAHAFSATHVGDRIDACASRSGFSVFDRGVEC